MRPRLLDLFACAGGAAVGYTRAGFDVWGVDIEWRKAYPYPLLVADALAVLGDKAFVGMFDAIHASPPCQENSRTRCLREAQGGSVKENGQDLLAPVREALEAIGKPYVIENVPDAPMRADLVLCGTQFGLGIWRDGERRPLKRHRWFESNIDLSELALPCQHDTGRPLGVYGRPSDNIPKGGQTAKNVDEAQRLMGIDWMSRWDDLKEALPPLYTHHIGCQLHAVVSTRRIEAVA